MPLSRFKLVVALLGWAFSVLFAWVALPPLFAHPDVIGAFAAGFVNPYAAGYAMDAITCWCILAVWVVHEAKTRRVRHGWVALLLGIVPGVAAGLAFYLVLRTRQEAAPNGHPPL